MSVGVKWLIAIILPLRWLQDVTGEKKRAHTYSGKKMTPLSRQVYMSNLPVLRGGEVIWKESVSSCFRRLRP